MLLFGAYPAAPWPQIGAERKKLEKIKERKIAQLQKAGVPEKYWSELARKKISV